MRLPVLVVGALAALTVIFALTPTAASARSTGAFYDASNADVWDELTQADKYAVENFESVIGRGDYTPWTAADVGGSRVPEDVAGELVRHFRSSIPTSAPGAEAAQSEVSAVLQETGMWPRISQGLGLGARGVATRLATRAIPALAGGFVLWDIGCAAGVGLPLCHHEHVRLTPEQVATIRFRFSGSGVGSDALCLPSAASNVLTQPPSSGVCPDQKLYRVPLSGTVVAPQPKMAPNVLDVEWASTNASGWKGVSGCWPGPPTGPAADYTNTYFSPSSISGAPFGQCNPVVEPVMPSGEQLQHLEGLNYQGQAYAETQCGQNSQGTPCWQTSYHTMVRAWYLDPGTTRTLEAPTTGTDPTWPSDGTATPTRLASDMPTRPERGGTTATKIGQALHDHPALRKEIVYVLNRQQPEDEPSWGVTTVDDGPAVGHATVPDCTGVAYDTCVSRLHAAGFYDIAQYAFPETILDAGNGEVVATDIDADESVDPESTMVTVGVNPPAEIKAKKDPRCETGEGVQSDPGPAPPDGTALPQYQTLESFNSIDASGDFPPYPPMVIPLRYGTKGFGWRKIKVSHGYGPVDAEQTRLALETDPAPGPALWENQKEFHYIYTVADGGGGSLQCVRSVVVQYGPDKNGQFMGVQNSYQGALVQP